VEVDGVRRHIESRRGFRIGHSQGHLLGHRLFRPGKS
jgi:hypothetical protein